MAAEGSRRKAMTKIKNGSTPTQAHDIRRGPGLRGPVIEPEVVESAVSDMRDLPHQGPSSCQSLPSVVGARPRRMARSRSRRSTNGWLRRRRFLHVHADDAVPAFGD